MSGLPNYRIKVEFAKCSLPQRRDVFKRSSCILPISVGQGLKVHEGEKFLATLHLVNRSFKTCHLLMDDSIQRHTLKIINFADEKTLHDMAVKEGDRWLERNKKLYEQLTIPYQISRWDDWLTHPQYFVYRSKIDNLFENHPDYQAAYRRTIEAFLKRYLVKKKSDIDYDKAYACCVDYLKEECAVMCLWAEEKYHVELYPSGRNEAMKATYDYLIRPINSLLLVSVSLHFKKKVITSSLPITDHERAGMDFSKEGPE